MQKIDKRPGPQFLAAYQNQPGADWDRDVRGDEKQGARQALCAEQHHLCCFCEGRIRPEVGSMKIAHLVPQAVDPGLMFQWHNLLGACLGGERRGQDSPRAEQHCDTRQGNQRLHALLDPTRLPPGLIRFRHSGQILSTNPDVQKDLDDTLNLNLDKIKRNRRAAALAMHQRMVKGHWTRADILRKRAELTAPDRVKREEYHSYLLWWLDRRLQS